MLAEMVDGVIGVDTHRDFNQVEIACPSGAVIATRTFTNDSAGHAEVLAWMVKHAPGPRLVLSIEGTRSYGVGLARAAATAGLIVIEAEQPTRKHRRGKDKSDRIDAHLAVLYALGLDADELPTPRSDGDREALRILLCARQELTTTTTGQTNRLRALLRDGDDTDHQLARARLTDTVLASLARRRLPAHASRQQAVRHGEIRRLALALRDAGRALATNPRRAGRDCLRPGSRAAQPTRDRPGQRRPSHRVVFPRWTLSQRCRLRQARGHQPDRSLQRPDHPPPAQSGWGPGAEQSPSRHRHDSDARRPRDPGLPRAPADRRQKRPRNPPLPQAVHCPPAISHPHRSNDPRHGGPHLMPPSTDSHDRRNHAKRS